jgi:hypothetical protein
MKKVMLDPVSGTGQARSGIQCPVWIFHGVAMPKTGFSGQPFDVIQGREQVERAGE